MIFYHKHFYNGAQYFVNILCCAVVSVQAEFAHFLYQCYEDDHNCHSLDSKDPRISDRRQLDIDRVGSIYYRRRSEGLCYLGVYMKQPRRLWRSACNMMTSSNGNIFRVTGHLCWEFTGHRWIPRTKASDAWMNDWVNNREASDLRSHRSFRDVIVLKMGKDIHDVSGTTAGYWTDLLKPALSCQPICWHSS